MNIKSFLEHRDQLFKGNQAEPILSQIYDIKDKIYLDPYRKEDGLTDFLVDYSQFIEYATKYNGHFAGFNKLSQFKEMIETISKLINGEIFIAPYWFSRTKDDILNFSNVYSDTIYVKVDDIFVTKYDLNKINQSIEADEFHIMTSTSGNKYVRIWWD